MTAGVYAIINTATGMAYVGSSIDIEKRWLNHRYVLNSKTNKPSAMIQEWRAMNGGGFEFIILETVEADDSPLEEAEQRWFDFYGDRLYNARRRAKRPRRDTLTLYRWGKLPPDEVERLLTLQYDLKYRSRRPKRRRPTPGMGGD
jgi:group I intron endonuclease